MEMPLKPRVLAGGLELLDGPQQVASHNSGRRKPYAVPETQPVNEFIKQGSHRGLQTGMPPWGATRTLARTAWWQTVHVGMPSRSTPVDLRCHYDGADEA